MTEIKANGGWRRWLDLRQRAALEPMQGMASDEKFDYLCIQVFDLREEMLKFPKQWAETVREELTRANKEVADALLIADKIKADALTAADAKVAIALRDAPLPGSWTVTAAQRSWFTALGGAFMFGVLAVGHLLRYW